MKNMLDRIIAHKATEVENAQKMVSVSELENQIKIASPPRGFINSIQSAHAKGKPALIAEIKKASPSKGLIREDFNPANLARAYQAGGASCISVLTDIAYFQGHPVFLKEVRAASSLPALRKDFMIDPYQVIEARAWGADCILVIMAAVDDAMAEALTNMAKDLGMDVLVEVHNRQELERALKLNARLIGINNRNLQTFDIKLETTEGLAPLIPKDRIVVSESGIFKHDDLIRLSRVGVKTYLVGECLMRQENVEQATLTLLGQKKISDKHPTMKNTDPIASDAQTSDVQTMEHPPKQREMGDGFQAAVEELGALIGTNNSGETDTSHESKPAPKLSHVNEAGAAHMVDISDKTITQRIATAEGFISMQPETLAQIQQNAMKKGDVLAAARLAGIMAAKKTSELIPLCHPLPVTAVEVEFTPKAQPETGILIKAMVKVDGKTGVEMEALTAVSVACLTIYDMAKAIDKGMCFSSIRLIKKTGGKSGTYRAPDAAE